MAKISDKNIIDSLSELKWDCDYFNPANGNFDSIFYEDRDFFIYALLTNGDALQYGSDDFKSDEDLVKIAIDRSSGSALQFAADKFKSDKNFLRSIDPAAFEYASDEVLSDFDFLNQFDLAKFTFLLEHKYDLIKSNKELVLKIISNSGYYLKYLPEEARSDFDIVKAAVIDNAYAYEFISDSLKANKEILLAALSRSGEALKWALDEFKADREIAHKAVKSYAAALCELPDNLKNDKELIKTALLSRSQNEDAMRCIPDDLLGDKEFVKELLYIDDDIFDRLDDTLRKDPDIKRIKKVLEI